MEFKFEEFNECRAMRGARAARVIVTDDGGEEDWLWMSRTDIQKNIQKFGHHPELLKAKLAYAGW